MIKWFQQRGPNNAAADHHRGLDLSSHLAIIASAAFIVAERNSKARSEDGTGDRRHGGVRASYRRNHSSFALLLLLERHFIPLIARQINPGTRIINGLSARSSTR